MLMLVIWLIVAGLCLGSFVNALVWRLHEGEQRDDQKAKGKKAKSGKTTRKVRQLDPKDLSILTGRSMCSYCHHSLAAKDLIPVVSWLWLRGKCRYCHHKIEDTPVAELLVPALFVFSYAVWPYALNGWGLTQFCFWLVFVVGFAALALYDMRWYVLPNKIVYPLIVLAAAQVAVHVLFFGGGLHDLLSAGWGIVIASGIFYVLFQVSKGAWIGGGDVKLGLVLGLLLGGPLKSLLLLFLASTIGSLVSLPLLISGRVKRSTLIPFGPFLLAAAFVLVLYGDRIVQWLDSALLG
jgi:prepilin signal peptidase PulO-like enzyme (type II secretory pathway)